MSRLATRECGFRCGIWQLWAVFLEFTPYLATLDQDALDQGLDLATGSKLCSSLLKGVAKKRKVGRHVEPRTRFETRTETANRAASTRRQC